MRLMRQLFIIVVTLTFLLTLGACLVNRNDHLSSPGPLAPLAQDSLTMPTRGSSQPEIRAVWVQARSVSSQKEIDAVLKRAEIGHFNALFVNTFVQGQALYNSDLVEKYERVEPDFDPLAYLVKAAHQRNIQVHAWLVAGPVGGTDGPILSQHPEWGMLSLDGEKANWLNYNRPDVRQFIIDLALEMVRKYKVDGIHFDYTRYPHPGWKWGFDAYSANAFKEAYNLDLEALRYTDLPAYGSFRGNPLAGVTTAQALAVFDDGQPAILLNNYGTGKVILFNWQADERTVAASSEILRRSLNYLQNEAGNLYILRSQTNAEKYGYGDFDTVFTWLEDIGVSPVEIGEEDITTLEVNDILIMPGIYLITAQTASDLADFVQQGGGVIFIDGPTPSIKDKNIQALLGVNAQGRHFDRTGLLIPVGQHALIPATERGLQLEDYLTRDAHWKTFRKQGINFLLQEVYQQVKQEDPEVLVTITVAASQEALAEKYFLDWQSWLEGEYVDLIIPRLYVEKDKPLAPVLADWQSVIDDPNEMMVGLSVFISESSREVKASTQILAEVDLARASGSRGIILFDFAGISDEVWEALGNGPFSSNINSN